MSVLVLTYHAVESGPPPLFVEPALMREQLDAVVASGAASLTVSELAEGLRTRRLPERAVVLTFDDGAASVASAVAPLLVERGLRATVFCVAGHLGATNDWPGRGRGSGFALASAAELGELARAGIEIASHGVEHRSLRRAPEDIAHREVVGSKERLEQALGVSVTSFAYPYGLVGAEALVRETYAAACTTELTHASAASDPLAIPRVDAHYLRSVAHLRDALAGNGRYLHVRRLGARARRLVVRDDA
jgi:peptidoglycan/xylan/chitin deacetylase (PgdA/CDA1 family)